MSNHPFIDDLKTHTLKDIASADSDEKKMHIISEYFRSHPGSKEKIYDIITSLRIEENKEYRSAGPTRWIIFFIAILTFSMVFFLLTKYLLHYANAYSNIIEAVIALLIAALVGILWWIIASKPQNTRLLRRTLENYYLQKQ
jgi:hypothetical protein